MRNQPDPIEFMDSDFEVHRAVLTAIRRNRIRRRDVRINLPLVGVLIAVVMAFVIVYAAGCGAVVANSLAS